METCIITGGLGFIGSEIVKLALTKYKVIVFDDFSTGKLSNLLPEFNCSNLTIIRGDIRNLKEVEEVVKKGDYIVHLAAKVSVPEGEICPDLYAQVNYIGSANVFCAAKKYNIKKVVFSSTSAVYGNRTTICRECDDVQPISIYGKTKAKAEELLKYSGLKYTIFRYFNVYGPSQSAKGGDGAVIPCFLL